jgi:PAS domain S-box-containing protein
MKKTNKKPKGRKFHTVNSKDMKRYKLLSYLMEHIPDVIYFKDKSGRLILVNQAHAKGLGLKPDQVIGKTDFDLFPKRRAEAMFKDDMNVIKTGKPIIDKIERATRPDGVDNYVSTTKIPQYDQNGKVIGIIGITRDITRRKRFEELKEEKARIQKRLELLEELNRLKSDFVSVVSHELRTPLAIIKELVTVVLNEDAGPINEKQRETVRRAIENVERLEEIICELLDISRIERDKLRLRYCLVNINDLLRESAAFFKRLAKEKGISLDYKMPKKQINLFVDADRINQVVSNLINNAIKFTEQGGRITVEVKILDTRVRIGVIDTGIGITKKDMPKLFDMFEQVSKKIDAEKKGIGLWLSLAKELVIRHGGEIWAESRLGVGSKFYFTLPRFYTPRLLNKRIKNKIDRLIVKGISVQFINLSILNFKEFREKLKVGPKGLFQDLKDIIKTTFKEAVRSNIKTAPVIITDIHHGNYSIMLPKTDQGKAWEFCRLLKYRIKSYFVRNKLEDVFIALGILTYPAKTRRDRKPKISPRVRGETYIASEMRRFRRVAYQADIRISSGRNKTMHTHTLDISEGGVCVVSESPFETDSRVNVKLTLPRIKECVYCKCRIAWIRKMDKAPGEVHDVYKVGLEFIDLKKKYRKDIIKELKL